VPLTKIINPLQWKGNYSAASNNMTFAHWPLMSGLLHLVQRRGDCEGLQPAPSYFSVPNVTDRQRPVYQSPYCCIMVPCSAVLTWPLKG